MGYRAHIQTKHEIEYDGSARFNWGSELVHDWIAENGVFTTDGDGDGGPEWELDKDQLREIPDEAFHDIGKGEDMISADELRDFVRDLIAAPTGDYAYVSWF